MRYGFISRYVEFEGCDLVNVLAAKHLLIGSQGRVPSFTLDCILYIRESFPGATVSVEVEKPGRPGLQQLAEVADVVIYSKGWAQVRNYLPSEI